MFNRKAISLYEVLTIQKENKPTKMIILDLNTIGQDIEGVSQPFGLYMAESAAVCFHSQGIKVVSYCLFQMETNLKTVKLNGLTQ